MSRQFLHVGDRVLLAKRLATYHGCDTGTVHALYDGMEDTVEVLLDNGIYTCTDPPRLTLLPQLGESAYTGDRP